MRSFPRYGFLVCASALLYVACEPDLDKLSTEYGFGGKSGTGGSGGGSADTGGATAAGGSSNNSGGMASNDAGFGGTETTGGTIGTEGGSPGMPDACSDNRTGFGESDVDCGGISTCPRCPVDAHCTAHTDCETGVCLDNKCSEPSCSDGVLNQDETGEDCGGKCAVVSPCDLGVGCKANSDCASEFCSAKVCKDHCLSKRKESDETGVDCGGSTCGPCANDQGCLEHADCASGVCSPDKICVAPSCTDTLKNQDESDVDCGGACSAAGKPCTLNQKCSKAADCDSYICTAGKCGADIVIPATDVIDDMEDGNMLIIQQAGRVGNWYTFGDGTGAGALEPFLIAGKRAGSTACFHYTGSGFMKWGSGIGFDFNNNGTGQDSKKPYDASAYTGITFWGKSAAMTSIPVQLPDINTSPAGGKCTTCDHHWGALVPFTTEWQRFTVRFSDLQLEPGTVPAPTAFDKSNIVQLQIFFSVGKTTEIWVDDVAFYK
jgi:hypothetical protein